MNEQNLPENTKNEVKETAVPVVSNDSQEINNDSPPKLKDDTGSKGDTDPKDNPQPATKDDPKPNTQSDNSSDSLTNEPFIDLIYNQIDSIIGGENPNQFLCLTLPGQVLTAKDFAYDYKNNAEKGPTVEANESRLANKLFDPCRITGGDNGLTLPYQYRSALDTLTPKLNEKIAKAKNQLRELLLTPYPYDFGDGDTKTYTLQEVFYRLYDEYVAAEQAWTEKQNKKKETLRKTYPNISEENNIQYNNEYLQWYETVARSESMELNEKRAKVLSVFAPNDMDILNGVLDSGSGAELEQARQILENIQRQTPDGGIVYPVKFNPTNWFELLNTSFIPSDLLESPESLAMRLRNLSTRRITLSSQISNLNGLIDDENRSKELKDAQTEAEKAKGTLDKAQSELINQYGEGLKTVIDTVFTIAPIFSGGNVPNTIISRLAKGLNFKGDKTADSLVEDLAKALSKNLDCQNKYINASQSLSNALLKEAENKNLLQLKQLIPPIQEQLEKINADIDEVLGKMQVSNILKSGNKTNGKETPEENDKKKPEENDKETPKVNDEKTPEPSNVGTPIVPDGFTQILIDAKASQLDKETNTLSSASNSTYGASLWFAGFSGKKETASSKFEEICKSQDTSIRIGMNVAKVGIEREWFNPGIFVLTKDMFNVSTSRVSPIKDYSDITEERLSDMSRGYILPCYPVAMLVAKDISIQVAASEQLSDTFSATMEEHASHGGGFLLFSGAKSSSTSFSSAGIHTSSTEKSFNIKITTPQIIGYYLQATPADKSTIIDEISDEETAAGFVTISKFVEDYKKLLQAMNKKNNTEQQD